MARELAWPKSTATWTEEEYQEDSIGLDEEFGGEGPDHYTNWPKQ